MRKRKRCPFCRCLFAPDGRVAHRQRACTKDECQAERRRDSRRRWREKHPEDGPARRCREALASVKASKKRPPVPRAPPRAMAQFPWEEVRDEITPEALVIAGFFVRLVLGATRDEIQAEVTKTVEKFVRLVEPPPGDETAPPAKAG